MNRFGKMSTVFVLAAMSVYAGRIATADDTVDPFATATATTRPVRTQTNVNVTDAGAVEIHVSEANLIDVLRMLSVQTQKNILASKEVNGTVTANLYDVTLHDALDAILHANGFTYREKGNFVYVYSVKEIADVEKMEKKATTEVFRLFYTPAANAVNMIKPCLSTEAQVSFSTAALAGIESGVKDSGGNSHATEDLIVVTDYPDRLDKVRAVLKQVDRRPQQILIEATIVRAALSEDNALGVDFNVVGGVDLSSVNATNTQVTGANLNTGTRTGETIHSIGTGNSFTSGINSGLKIGVVTNNVSMFVSALEGVTDTSILANPKILSLNKQKGEVIVGREDGYITTTVTETAQTQTVDFLKTGTRLIFRPYIADDGFIRMEIHPEDSSGGLQGTANLPFKITTEVTSNVLVKDGRTIVIGGLFREASSTTKSQTPGLGSIPLLGALFRQQKDATTREEIIILLTPHIVKDDSIYSEVSEAELKRLSQLRVGVRLGMMPWGRERLAESAYNDAVAEMNKVNPNTGLALWNLERATNLNPKFTEAIEMKQRLSGEVLKVTDNATIRDFIRTHIIAEQNRRNATTQPGTVQVEKD